VIPPTDTQQPSCGRTEEETEAQQSAFERIAELSDLWLWVLLPLTPRSSVVFSEEKV
jgi:hypothetical protein